ncbi:MarR family transcriptional regulator [Actinomadura hibisca]|uniref:MarR family transcriptional regulator n=1 Tax=Actinomadura hibisca TaxID=68565 RepID=UPI001FE08C21|nr:MarR family transcriptional regulator [Actinomadura hibisca]
MDPPDADLAAAVRTMLLSMPRIVGTVKKIKIPEALRSFDLAPRHLSLLSFLLFDGPLGVSALAERLEVAPATVSLMVGDLGRQGILERRADPADRRRAIIAIADAHRPAIDAWLATGASAWREALEPLTPEQRRMVIDTFARYEQAAARSRTAAEGAG